MKIIYSKKCLNYGKNHIENSNRVKEAKNMLDKRKYDFLAPEPTTEEYILKIHSRKYIQKLKGGIEDSDTPAYKNIYEYAKLSAGGAILAAKTRGFSLMRPPGHHVGENGTALRATTRGFCYLNNIAIAVQYLNKKTLILDIDGHHGNGTEEIFLGKEQVIYLSLHRCPLYPGTGFKSNKNCFNFPLTAECGEKVYLTTLERALNKIDLGKIEIVAVSAGFDGHIGDLASLGLNENSFQKIGKIIGELKKHTFFVLEGGYVGRNIGKDVDALIKGFETQN